jgi:hypothetical protein
VACSFRGSHTLALSQSILLTGSALRLFGSTTADSFGDESRALFYSRKRGEKAIAH